MTVLIFANGEMRQHTWVRPYLAQATAVIAADGGTRHLLSLGRLPDLIIGDMDSRPPEGVATVPQLQFPALKDETDLELALLYAASTYADDILVFAPFGGRVDQMLGNIFLLAHPALAGRTVQLLDEYQRLRLIVPEDGLVTIYGRAGDKLSLIPCSQDVLVQTTIGLRWSLQTAVLRFGPARGISNEMETDTVQVQVGNGRLICIHTDQTWQR